MRKIANRKQINRKIWIVAIPIMLQNLIDAAVSSADVLMLNFVGQSAISAVSLANSMIGVFFMFLYGIGTGIAMLSAQYYGKGDLKTIEKIEGIGLRFSLSVALLGALLALTVPEYLMRIYTNDAVLIELGAKYLRMIAPGLLFWAVSAVYMSILRCIDKVSVSTVLEVTALFSNVILNAVFIFGLFGAPKLGVVGVGIATMLSRMLQLAGCVFVSVRLRPGVRLRLKTIFTRNRVLGRDFVSMAMPAIANDLVWALGFSAYSGILGHLGDDAVAAFSVNNVVRNLGTVMCYGIAEASGIITGQILGEGDREQGIDAGHLCLRLSVLTGLIGGLAVMAMTPFTVHIMSLSETASDYLRFMLLINGYYIMGTAVNTTLIAGVFRAGGDSRFGFRCDLIDMWVYAVPLGLIAAFVLKLPVKWVYFLLCTDEFVKWPWVFAHFYKYGWAKNITRDTAELAN
ncbi:MAG: MATE family efflux transporter [Lachnospiraceae bacterium]|nr:MATE family efflux transporter [Lachnospiraceae bacterium]